MTVQKVLWHQINSPETFKTYKYLQVIYRHIEKKYMITFKNENTSFSLDNPNNIYAVSQCVDRDKFIVHCIKNILEDKEKLKCDRKKTVIDFSSPNIAKPFHMGHLRSTIIGNFIANIKQYHNNEVYKINYLGDWGTQFGLLQYGLNAKNWDINDVVDNPIKKLYEAYIYANKLAAADEKVHEKAKKYFFDIEQGTNSLETWKKICQITVQEIEKVYKRLGVTFNEYHWESDYNSSAIKSLVESLEKQNIIKTDETGRKFVDINDRIVTFMKSDNSSLYLSRDVAALLDRYRKYKFDEMLYVVDNSQTDHFSSLFEVAQKINTDFSDKCKHIKFGRIRGMSTRRGNVVFLQDILDEAKEKMYEQQKHSVNTKITAMNNETCDILGTTAVIINDLKQKRQRDYDFCWHKALQSEGDSGIKLQYLHCRLWSLEQSCGVKLPTECLPELTPEQIVGEVVCELSKFDNIMQRACDEYEACILVGYLFRLTKHVNRMLSKLRVKNVNTDVAAQRLLVFHAARLVVKRGLETLGVRPLNEM